MFDSSFFFDSMIKNSSQYWITILKTISLFVSLFIYLFYIFHAHASDGCFVNTVTKEPEIVLSPSKDSFWKFCLLGDGDPDQNPGAIRLIVSKKSDDTDRSLNVLITEDVRSNSSKSCGAYEVKSSERVAVVHTAGIPINKTLEICPYHFGSGRIANIIAKLDEELKSGQQNVITYTDRIKEGYLQSSRDREIEEIEIGYGEKLLLRVNGKMKADGVNEIRPFSHFQFARQIDDHIGPWMTGKKGWNLFIAPQSTTMKIRWRLHPDDDPSNNFQVNVGFAYYPFDGLGDGTTD